MFRHTGDRARATLALIGLALAVGPAAAQVAPPAKQGSSPTPWNTATAPRPASPPAEDSTLALRVYDDFGREKLPYRPGPPRRGDPAWATDVSAVMTRCPDGNLVITALVIGGQLTPLESRCPGDKPPGQSAAPQCDANAWNCAAGSRD